MNKNRKPGRKPTSDCLEEVKRSLGLMVMIERKSTGMTQKECATKLGISEAAWGNSERAGNASIERLLEMIAMINLAALPDAMALVRRGSGK